MILHVKYAILSFYFGLFFALLQLKQLKKKIKKKKKKKKHLDISSFYMRNKKHDHMMYSSRDMVGNGWNNGWKK